MKKGPSQEGLFYEPNSSAIQGVIMVQLGGHYGLVPLHRHAEAYVQL